MRRERSARTAGARPKPSARINLPRPTGGHIDIYGDPDAQRIVVIVGRDDFLQDEELVGRLIGVLVARNVAVARYESHNAETQRRTTPHFARTWPRRWQVPLRSLVLVAIPSRWRHYSPRYRARTNSIAARAEALRAALSVFRERDVVLLARSAGARISTLVADDCGVKAVVALGYPFENPDEGPNPDRYRHLEHLRTPLLILQGSRDPYGGTTAKDKYRLSPTATLEFVDTDHSMELGPQAWESLSMRILDHVQMT